MKYRHLVLIILLTVISTGCKQDNWIDWKLQNELWLQNNLTQSGVQLSPSGSGLQYKTLYEGNLTDAQPSRSATVIVDYTGWLINGVKFDEGKSTSFSMSNLTEGFAEGLTLMHVGGDYIFYIPYELAYGEEGRGKEGGSAYIPPYSALKFEVHLSAVLEN